MKKLTIIVLSLMLMAAGLHSGLIAESGVFVGVKGNLLFPADSNYKDIYGSGIFSLGAELGYKFNSSIYIAAGFDKVKKSGETLILKEKSESDQNYISLGIGYLKKIGDSFFLRGDAGVLSVSYEEKAFGEKVEGNTLGAYLQGGAGVLFGSGFYLSALVGYINASDNIGDLKIKLGGFKTAIILGFSF